jgi:tetratricopeptide (TPR) repeat protein
MMRLEFTEKLIRVFSDPRNALMTFDFDTPKTFIEKANKAIDLIVEDIFRQRNWRSLLVLIDVILFLTLNPFQWPFPNLLTPFPQLLSFGWYRPAFWSLIAVIFVIAVIVAARAKRISIESFDVKPGPIKGLLPFGYDDAEDFAHLQRSQNLKECLQAIGNEHWRFGVLSGESGAGKTSFLQAGLWPALEKRRARCVYVKFSDLDPFESVIRACRKHLSECGVAAEGTDFLNLLSTATALESSPVILLFDQFEQFFVHLKSKSDRALFVQALTQWFTAMEALPVRLLICIRSDFHDRLNELQKAMMYSLGPTQSFRLERFEPEQATEVFCFLAEKEGLEHDRKFISEMTRQELIDTEDGLISPVDVQVLARMIQRQTVQEDRAFNRSTFQKLGGVEGLLDRYLTSTLETRETPARRQAAIKVLLALTDLERNTRAGALTAQAIGEKLGGDVTDAELKESILWLQRGDVRLISPSLENIEDKFELAHERMIPALRRLAGKQLSDADRADQLLDRRTNEWLGNGQHSRYLFSWSEFHLIRKYKRFITWGKERQAKEELLADSAKRLRLRFAAAGMTVLIVIAGWIEWNSNAWQTYLIKRDLRTACNNLKDDAALIAIAQAFVYAGDLQFPFQVVTRIVDDRDRANALRMIAGSIAKLGDKEKASSLRADATKAAERISDHGDRAIALLAIAESYAELGDKEKASSLLTDTIKAAVLISHNRDRADALLAVAESYAKLGDKEKAKSLRADAIKATERIGVDSERAYALRAIAESYAKLGDKEKASSLLADAIKTVERINDDNDRAVAMLWIARSIAMIGDKEKASSLLADMTKAAEQISDHGDRAVALRAIAESYAELKDKEKASSLLVDAIKAVERISDDRDRSSALGVIAQSYAKLGETMKDSSLLVDAIKVAERISDDFNATTALRAIAGSIAKLENKEKASSLRVDEIKAAERISYDPNKVKALLTIAMSYAELGGKMKDRPLLADAIKAAERISGNTLIRADALRAIARSYAELGDKEKASSLLADAIKAVERISKDRSHALGAIAMSYAKLGETMKDSSPLVDAIKVAERITNYGDKAVALGEIAGSYAELGDKEKASLLLADAIKAAERISYNGDRADALLAIAKSHAKLGDKKKASSLLTDAIHAAEQISDDSDSSNGADALGAIAESIAKLTESSKIDQTLYDKTFGLIEGLRDDFSRDRILNAVLSSKLAVADVSKLRSLTMHYGVGGPGKARALSRILMACSHPELIGKE